MASPADIQKIAQAVVAAQKSNGIGTKMGAGALSVIVLLGATYVSFFQPGTLAAASDNAQEQIRAHTELVHRATDKRLDRIESKLDRLIERK